MPGRKTYVGTATETTLAAGINSTDTTITLADGSTYGSPTVAAPMVIVVGAETPAEEQILISGRSVNVLTVAANGRNYQAGGGTTGVPHALGEVIRHVLDADSVNDANRHVNADADDDHSQYLNTARHDIDARHAFLRVPAIVTSGTRPGTPVEGQMIYETDTDDIFVYNGTNWVRVHPARLATKTGGVGLTTSGTTASTIVSVVIPAQNFPYRVDVYANVFHTQTVSTDSFALAIKNGAATSAVGRGMAQVESLQVHDIIEVPGGGTVTINITLTRAAGTGTASTFADTTSNYVITTIEAL